MDCQFLSKESLKFLQITDLHLFASKEGRVFGIDSNDRFNQVIDYIKQHDLHDTDAIILTGDLSQDETPESYLRIMMSFKDFKIPVYWIPGNHDNLALMKSLFESSTILCYQKLIRCQYWHFIFLSTNIPEEASGYLKEDELRGIVKEIEKLKKTRKKLRLLCITIPLI